LILIGSGELEREQQRGRRLEDLNIAAIGAQQLAASRLTFFKNWFGLVQVHVSLSSQKAEVEYLLDLSHGWHRWWAGGRPPSACNF
jgi:hypothetical protein